MEMSSCICSSVFVSHGEACFESVLVCLRVPLAATVQQLHTVFPASGGGAEPLV